MVKQPTSVALESDLIEQLDLLAKKEKRSRNYFVNFFISKGLKSYKN